MCLKALEELLACPFIHLAGHLNPAQPVYVLGDAAVKRLGDALAVVAGGEAMLVGGIADKRNLGKNRGHVGADEHDEGSLLHAAVANGRAFDGKATVE